VCLWFTFTATPVETTTTAQTTTTTGCTKAEYHQKFTPFTVC